MHPEDEVFARMALIPGALEKRGFDLKDGAYILRTTLPKSGFDLTLEITPSGRASGRATDPDTGDEYAPLHAANPTLAFACMVQDEYRRLLEEIASECFRPRSFASDQGNRLEALINDAWGDVPDNPFSNMDAGAFRTPGGKWYALVMMVPRDKLAGSREGGAGSDEGRGSAPGGLVEAANLKADPEEIPSLIQRDGIFKAWHMNKRHWITVLLDGTLDDASLMTLVARSRALVMGGHKGGA